MSNNALSWAWDRAVEWPLAKLLLIRIAEATVDGPGHTPLGLSDLVDFTGAHGPEEVTAGLEYLARKGLIHLAWYAPPEVCMPRKAAPRGIPVGVRTCEPGCEACAPDLVDKPPPPAWVLARREWQRLRSQLMPRLLERDGAACQRCGATEDLTGDHVVPLRRGGTNQIENLQVLCRPCNTRKHTSDN